MYTDKTIYEHEEAFSNVVENGSNILRHGLPAESGVGKLVDKLMPRIAEIKEQNESLIKELLSKEMDINYIDSFVCHDLEKQAARFLAIAILEESHLSAWDEEFDGRSDFRDVHDQYSEAASAMRNAIKDMREREAKMMPETTLSITKSQNGSYTITILRAKGIKRQAEVEGDNVEYKQTSEKKRREKQRTMKLGKMSQALREEKASYNFVLSSEKKETTVNTQNPDKDHEQNTSSHGHSIGEFNVTKTRTTRVYGNRKARLDLHFHAARLSGRKIKSHLVGPNKEQKEISNGHVELLGGSASIQAPTADSFGTYVLSAEAHPIQAGANVLGFGGNVGAGVSASIGQQWSLEELIKKAAQTLASELINGSAANLTRVIDEVAEMLKGIGPSSNINWGNINISAAGIDLFKVQVEPQEEQDQTRIEITAESPAQQEIENIVDSTSDIVEDIQDAINQLDEVNKQENVITTKIKPVDAHEEIDLSDRER